MKTLASLLKLILLLALCLCWLTSCDPHNQSADEYQIREIIYDIARDFSWGDTQSIFSHLHPSYRHNGMQAMQFRELWLTRAATYNLLSCAVSKVEIAGDYATVQMTMSFQSSTASVDYEEPQTSGDISYFMYDQGKWQLYGNQSLTARVP